MTKIVSFEQCRWYEVLALFQYIMLHHQSGKLALKYHEKELIISFKSGKILRIFLRKSANEQESITNADIFLTELRECLFDAQSTKVGWSLEDFYEDDFLPFECDTLLLQLIQSTDFTHLGQEFLQALPELGTFEISIDPEDTRPIHEKIASLPPQMRKTIVEKPIPVFEILKYCSSWEKKEWAGFLSALWKGFIHFTLPEKEKKIREQPPNLVSFYETALETIYSYLYKELQSFSKILSQEIYTAMQGQYTTIFPPIPKKAETHSFFWQTLMNKLSQKEITLEQFGEIVDDWILRHLLATQNILGRHHYTTLVEILHTLRAQKTARK